MEILIITAIAQNGIIGDSVKGLPWHIPEEFKHFKETTLGYPIVVGFKTFTELGKPLKGRLNIVLNNSENLPADTEDTKYFSSIDSILNFCTNNNFSKIFIIGGAQVYKSFLPYATGMIITYLKFAAEGDISFPQFAETDWSVTEIKEFEKFDVHYYQRKAEVNG